MGDIIFFFIIFNTIIVSILLWFITFLGSYLYNVKNDLNRHVHFECGFFSTNKLTPEYNFNFIISAVFLILYDVEFLLFIPIFFNYNFINVQILFFFLIFFLSVLYSLILDIETNTIKWYYN